MERKFTFGLDVKHAALNLIGEGPTEFRKANERLNEVWVALKAIMEPPPTTEDYRRWRRVEEDAA